MSNNTSPDSRARRAAATTSALDAFAAARLTGIRLPNPSLRQAQTAAKGFSKL